MDTKVVSTITSHGPGYLDKSKETIVGFQTDKPFTVQGSRHMEYNRTRRDKKAAAFYVSADWRRTRAAALRLYDGMDMYAYYMQHRIVTADMVHHIVEIGEDWEKRLDMANLFPLSNSNHGIISALYDRDGATKKAVQEIGRAHV